MRSGDISDQFFPESTCIFNAAARRWPSHGKPSQVPACGRGVCLGWRTLAADPMSCWGCQTLTQPWPAITVPACGRGVCLGWRWLADACARPDELSVFRHQSKELAASACVPATRWANSSIHCFADFFVSFFHFPCSICNKNTLSQGLMPTQSQRTSLLACWFKTSDKKYLDAPCECIGEGTKHGASRYF